MLNTVHFRKQYESTNVDGDVEESQALEAFADEGLLNTEENQQADSVLEQQAMDTNPSNMNANATASHDDPCVDDDGNWKGPSWPGFSLQAGFATTIGRRNAMEDRVTVARIGGQKIPPTDYFAVFDGHGGSQAASYAAAALHMNLAASEDYANGGIAAALQDAFVRTDADFIESVASDSGTTALVACVAGRSLVVANAGDCRGVLCTGDASRAVRLSEDHKPNRADEKARIMSAGGDVEFLGCWRVKSRDHSVLLATSRALGDRHFKLRRPHIVTAEPDVITRVLDAKEDRFIVLACDGLWDVLTDEEACRLACVELQRLENSKDADANTSPLMATQNEEPSPHQMDHPKLEPTKVPKPLNKAEIAAQKLVTEAFDRGSQDNISVLLVRIVPQTD